MSYYYDEELPRGFQDADFEQREFEAESRHIDQLRRAGICTHQSWVGLPASGEIFYDSQIGLTGTQVRCTDLCLKVFESEEALWADSQEARQ